MDYLNNGAYSAIAEKGFRIETSSFPELNKNKNLFNDWILRDYRFSFD